MSAIASPHDIASSTPCQRSTKIDHDTGWQNLPDNITSFAHTPVKQAVQTGRDELYPFCRNLLKFALVNWEPISINATKFEPINRSVI